MALRPETTAVMTPTYCKTIGLAANGRAFFSNALLRPALSAGTAIPALTLASGLSVVAQSAIGDPAPASGSSSTIVVIAFLGGVNKLMTGVIGVDVGRICAEARAERSGMDQRSSART